VPLILFIPSGRVWLVIFIIPDCAHPDIFNVRMSPVSAAACQQSQQQQYKLSHFFLLFISNINMMMHISPKTTKAAI
jgi:hypothetical protein